MTPYYADDWLTVYHGDALAVLSELPTESVHCVVTSPPYWGLRDYGTASWSGGDADCDHLRREVRAVGERKASTLVGTTETMRANEEAQAAFRDRCGKCGAVREDGQLGLEATPEAYVAAMVAVFREVRRVLRKDGTVWLNLGDTMWGGKGTNGTSKALGNAADRGFVQSGGTLVSEMRPQDGRHPDLKPKDLVGIPWRVAFALQADGWYLRSDIVWAKPNPMPESVTDRPTKAHEYVFLLSRSSRYYFDADAVREEAQPESAARYAAGYKQFGVGQFTGSPTDLRGPKAIPAEKLEHLTGRNLRSVWQIATQPYPGAHFAVFPEALVEPCVKAGTSERGVCPECGAPWQRIVMAEVGRSHDGPKTSAAALARGGRGATSTVGQSGGGRIDGTRETTGWRPSCGHDGEPVPATVLDMFAGSGTVGLVAQRLSRRAVLIDLSMDYLGQLMDRNRDIPLGLGA